MKKKVAKKPETCRDFPVWDNFRRNAYRIIESEGIKIIELADRMGLAHNHVSEILGGRFAPNLRTVSSVADALKVDPISLFAPTTYQPKDRTRKRVVKKAKKS